jgi:hypothetical protein
MDDQYYPPAYPYAEPPRRPIWPWVLGCAATLLVTVLVTTVVVMIVRPTHQSPTTGTIAVTPTTTAVTSTSTVTITQTASVPPPPPAPTYSGSDPEVAAANQLNEIVAADSSFVSQSLSGYWVPQLSSKKAGTADDGGVYDDVAILNEHLLLRANYGAKLITKNGYWVSVAPYTFSSKAGADRWCAIQGRDSWHCFGARTQ